LNGWKKIDFVESHYYSNSEPEIIAHSKKILNKNEIKSKNLELKRYLKEKDIVIHETPLSCTFNFS